MRRRWSDRNDMGMASLCVWVNAGLLMSFMLDGVMYHYNVDGLVRERRNSIANALELHLSCTNPSTCVGIISGNGVIIGSCNGLAPVWCQAIIWTNADWSSTGSSETNYSESKCSSFHSFQDNPCENVYKIAAILLRHQCVTPSQKSHDIN